MALEDDAHAARLHAQDLDAAARLQSREIQDAQRGSPDPAGPGGSAGALDEDQDSLRWTFSYGYALCSTLHGNIGPQIEAIGRALGKDWRSRWVDIPGDTNHEIYFAGHWRMFDVNAAALLWSSDDLKTAELLPFAAAFGTKNGPNHADLLENAPRFNGKYLPKLVYGKIDRYGEPEPCTWMRTLLALPMYWDNDTDEGRYCRLCLNYYAGYNACPIVYGLKRGETFTRWFDGDEARKEMGLPGRIWWGSNIEGGPGMQCDWSYYLKDLPACCSDTPPLIFSKYGQYDNTDARRDYRVATHGNGLYDWQPDLAAGDWEDAVVAMDGRVRGDGSGIRADGTSSVTFGFFSPYTIAARPADNKDPAMAGATDGAVLEAGTAGAVPVEVSVNNGQTFQAVGTLGAGNRVDFTDAVKGRNQYLLRMHLDRGRLVKSLRLRTVVTTCRALYPKLKSGKTTITYLADGLDGFDASPDFTSEQLATAPASFASQENLIWSGYDDEDGLAWRTNKGVADCVYRVTAPRGRILESVSAAASLTWPVPAKKGCWAEIAISGSPQGPWTAVRRVDPQEDGCLDRNDFPWYWIYGGASLSHENLETAYVRVRFAGAGKPCGITYLYLYGTYRTAIPSPLSISYYWKSGETMQHHSETIPAGQQGHTYRIDTGKDVKNVKVVFATPASR